MSNQSQSTRSLNRKVLPDGAHVMVASSKRLHKVHIVNHVQVRIRDDEEDTALDVLDVKAKPNLQQRCMYLLSVHMIQVSHVGEFLENLLCHTSVLVEDIA